MDGADLDHPMHPNPGAAWDARYTAAETVYGWGPNHFFAKELSKLPPGRLLLPGDGEGRNAIHAAKAGWSVRSFDASAVGVEKCLNRAAKEQLWIEVEVGDCQDWEPDEEFDLIGLFYLHLPSSFRRDFHRRMHNWLIPGGLVLLEGFGPGQLAFDSGGPKERSMLFTPEMLEADFADLDVLRCTTEEVILDEGPYHQGRAEVTRMLARKPR